MNVQDATPRPQYGWSTAQLLSIGLLAATALGGAYGAQRVLLRVARDQPPLVLETLGLQLVPWYAWALLLPWLATISSRWPITAANAWRRAGLHAALGGLVSMAHTALCVVPIGVLSRWTVVSLPLPVAYEQLLLNRGVAAWVEYALLMAILQAALFQQRARMEAAHAHALSRQLAESELAALQMQLEPHFLFNTLNAIGAYIRVAPTVAEDMLGNLSGLLRRVLDGRHDPLSTVGDEIALMERYLAIHQVRFGARLTVRVQVDAAAERAMLPTLLLQPIAENAIMHGVSLRPEPARIEVSARRDGDWLHLCVRDGAESSDTEPGEVLSPVTSPPSSDRRDVITGDATRRGVGLANTRARLTLLYGVHHACDIVTTTHETTVSIALPFETSMAP